MPRWTPPGEMRRVLTIEEPVVSEPNDYGEVWDTWRTVARLYAKIDGLSSREYVMGRELVADNTIKINTRWHAGITTFMRGVVAGLNPVYFANVRDVEMRHRELEIVGVQKDREPEAQRFSEPTGIFPAIVAHLLEDSAVAALVSTRVRPVKLHHSDVYPAIVYRVLNQSPIGTSGGEDPSGSATCRFSVESIARSYADARALAQAVHAALVGDWGAAGTPSISVIQMDPESDSDIELEPAQDAGIYTVSQDYLAQFATEAA